MHALRPFTTLCLLLGFGLFLCMPAQAQEKEDTNVTLIFVDHEDQLFNIGWTEPKYPFYQYGPDSPRKGELPLEHSLPCTTWNTVERYDHRWQYHPETNFCLPKIFADKIPDQMVTDEGKYLVDIPPNEEGIVTQMNFTVPAGEHVISFRRSFKRYVTPRFGGSPREVETYIVGQSEWTLSGDISQTIFVRLINEDQLPTVTNTTETIGLFLLRPVTEWDGSTMTVNLAGDIDPLFGRSSAYRDGDHLITHRPDQHLLPGEYVLLWANYWPKWDFGSCQMIYTPPDVSQGELDIILASEKNVCYAYDTLIVEKKDGVVTTRTERRGQAQPPKDVFFSIGGKVILLGQRVVVTHDSRAQVFGPGCWYQSETRWTRNEDCTTRYE